MGSRYEQEKLSRAIEHIEKAKREIGAYRDHLDKAIFLLKHVRVK